MSPEENETVVRRYFDELLNGRNTAVVDEIIAPGFRGFTVEHKGELAGIAAYKQAIAAVLEAFPDYHVTIDDCITAGDKVVVRWAARGTHRGVYLGVPATGTEVAGTAIGIFRLAGGRIVEQWCAADTLDILMQLGVVPTFKGEPLFHG